MVTVGELLREWRKRRRMSQLDLALAADVSARHVSLVETGKSRPSADMVLRLAAQLDVPLRDRNRLLFAAGHAPRYRERPLTGCDLEAAHDAVVAVLRAHEPYPALVIDRRWNIVLTNDAVDPFFGDVDPELLKPPVNMVRLGLHPRGLAPKIVNFAQARAVIRARLSRQLAQAWDPELAALYDELLASDAGDDATTVPIESEIAIPMIIRHRGYDLKLFSTITTFGTPQDITLDEIAIESYYPADAQTAEIFRHLDVRATAG
ncbi:helix-turn-helix domain-containing protein [Phytoactinopolyspora halotolerans]|uniref:Helix-turn-helix domain-containing protein n=1 Tax=Phytoactinopolyspora halotolerans TaxID=1981512 RepID=A0A6L9SEV4_9ACTN|nr:helix-turn-helix transcriptional regulator [Phytoactinopolyspora halotolerans]NEE03955.1 helix-turn-helix domain-containing protein [Phytoactinopolyspora halotolerans]